MGHESPPRPWRSQTCALQRVVLWRLDQETESALRAACPALKEIEFAHRR